MVTATEVSHSYLSFLPWSVCFFSGVRGTAGPGWEGTLFSCYVYMAPGTMAGKATLNP